jgi:hypothetical protein
MGDSIWDKCCKHSDVCNFGVFIGIVIALILVWIFYAREQFLDPTLSPQAKQLLAYHDASDPTSATAMRKIYGENMENKKESPALVATLYR